MVVKKQVRGLFHEIVVPTDCSSGSARALEFALALVRRGSRVTAVHAVDSLQYKFGPRESSKVRKQRARALAQESCLVGYKRANFLAATQLSSKAKLPRQLPHSRQRKAPIA